MRAVEGRNGKLEPMRQKDRDDRLDFLHSMLAELRTMAETERHDMLAYLIGMAHAEAGDLVRKRRSR